MTGDSWESKPHPDELQGELRHAVNRVRAAPLPEEAEQRVVDRAMAWAVALNNPESRPPEPARPQ